MAQEKGRRVQRHAVDALHSKLLGGTQEGSTYLLPVSFEIDGHSVVYGFKVIGKWVHLIRLESSVWRFRKAQ